jgi:hypothetical protein
VNVLDVHVCVQHLKIEGEEFKNIDLKIIKKFVLFFD